MHFKARQHRHSVSFSCWCVVNCRFSFFVLKRTVYSIYGRASLLLNRGSLIEGGTDSICRSHISRIKIHPFFFPIFLCPPESARCDDCDFDSTVFLSLRLAAAADGDFTIQRFGLIQSIQAHWWRRSYVCLCHSATISLSRGKALTRCWHHIAGWPAYAAGRAMTSGPQPKAHLRRHRYNWTSGDSLRDHQNRWQRWNRFMGESKGLRCIALVAFYRSACRARFCALTKGFTYYR